MLFEDISIEEIVAIRCKEAHEEGREIRDKEIARNLLLEGSSPEFIQKITGLDIETIKKLSII